jgi:hypothetical protein
VVHNSAAPTRQGTHVKIARVIVVLPAALLCAALAAAPGRAPAPAQAHAQAPAPARTPSGAIQGLDHIPIAVADLSAAAERYRALGFALKPGRPHTNGITNQHVKFSDGTELELITASESRDALTAKYRKHVTSGDGPAFLAFFAPAPARVPSRLNAPLDYIFFGGRNASPTDRPEHFAHANGAQSFIRVWLAADDLRGERELLRQYGATFVRETVTVPDAVAADVARLPAGEVVFLPGSRQIVKQRRIVGATVRVKSLETARRLIAGTRLRLVEGAGSSRASLFLPPDVAHGLWLELRQTSAYH